MSGRDLVMAERDGVELFGVEDRWFMGGWNGTFASMCFPPTSVNFRESPDGRNVSSGRDPFFAVVRRVLGARLT